MWKSSAAGCESPLHPRRGCGCRGQRSGAHRQGAGVCGRTSRRRSPSKIGILLRKKNLMPRLIADIRRAHPDVDVSGEGGNPLTDSRAVEVILEPVHLARSSGQLGGALPPASRTARSRKYSDSPLAETASDEGGDTRSKEDNLGTLPPPSSHRAGAARPVGARNGSGIPHLPPRAAITTSNVASNSSTSRASLMCTRPDAGSRSSSAHVRTRRVERPGGSRRSRDDHPCLEGSGVRGRRSCVEHRCPRTRRPRRRRSCSDPRRHVCTLSPRRTTPRSSGLAEDSSARRNVREDFMEELSVLYVGDDTRAILPRHRPARGCTKAHPSRSLLRAALLPVGRGSASRRNFDGALDARMRITPEPRRTATIASSHDPGVAISAATMSAATKKLNAQSGRETSPFDAIAVPEFVRTVHVTPSGTNERGHHRARHAPPLARPNRSAMRRGDFIPRAGCSRFRMDRRPGLPDAGFMDRKICDRKRTTPQGSSTANFLPTGLMRLIGRSARQTARNCIRALAEARSAQTGEDMIELWRERTVCRGPQFGQGRAEMKSPAAHSTVSCSGANHEWHCCSPADNSWISKPIASLRLKNEPPSRPAMHRSSAAYGEALRLAVSRVGQGRHHRVTRFCLRVKKMRRLSEAVLPEVGRAAPSVSIFPTQARWLTRGFPSRRARPDCR